MSYDDMRKTTRAGHLARALAVVAVALAAAVWLCAHAPDQAYADNGSVTIESAAPNAQPQGFKAYRVFAGDVDADGEASHLSWNGAYKQAVLAYLHDKGYGDWLAAEGHTAAGAADVPQNAAEFIAESIAGGEWDPADAVRPLTPAGSSFATGLAQVLAKKQATGSAQAGSAYSAEQGYYLFVADTGTLTTGEAGTAPIWVPLGQGSRTVAEKAAAPTFVKEVADDADGMWGKAADANKGQQLSYRLTATVPELIGSYASYHMRFVDTLPAGMALESANVSSVAVKVGGADVTAKLGKNAANAVGGITWSGGVLTVDIADVLAVPGAPKVGKDTKVVVEYRAQLTDEAAIGAAGNENSAVLLYPKDPVSLSFGEGDEGSFGTPPSTTKTYAYQLDFQKLDKQTHEPLAGAKFTMRVDDPNTDAGSVGKYVQADGSLADAAYEFETDAEGRFSVPRIDEGNYVLHETQVPATGSPDRYDATPDIGLTITSSFDADGNLAGIDAQLVGGEPVNVPGIDIATHLEGADVQAGTVSVLATNDKVLTMPLTGMDGATALLVYGTASVALGAGGICAGRRRRAAVRGSHAAGE